MLNKKYIFFGLLSTYILFNLINIFRIDNLILSTIISSLFLFIVPGLLLILILKIRGISIWEYLVYSIGLSISFLLFIGLVINWVLPLFGIAKPLSSLPLLVSIDIVVAILGVIAYIRNNNFVLEFKKSDFSKLDYLFGIASVTLPVISIFGTMILNNGGPNYLALINYFLIPLCVLFIAIFYKKINPNILLLSVMMISISLLFSGSLRSWYISGSDINREFQVFKLTKDNQLWSISSYYNVYNSCLSITILPTILSSFFRIEDQYITKLIIPLIFSTTPLVIYLISKKYSSDMYAYISTFFFMSQPAFIFWYQIPLRQELGFLFFALSILILLDEKISIGMRRTLFLIFSLFMIVSHYSTAYIAIAIYMCMFLFKTVLRFKISILRRLRSRFAYGKKSTLTGIILVILAVFTFLWYSQITYGFSGLTDFFKKSIGNINIIFSQYTQAGGQSVFDQFNIIRKPLDAEQALKTYSLNATYKYQNKDINSNYYDNISVQEYNIVPQFPKGLPFKYDDNIIFFTPIARECFKLIAELLVIIGSIYFLYKQKNINHFALYFASIIVLVISTLMPFISVSYDLSRLYQQALIILSPTAIMAILFIFKYLKKNIKVIVITIFFVLYFLFLSRTIQQFVGGNNISMIFNNLGSEYAMVYTHNSDIISANWLAHNFNKISPIFVDPYAILKTRLTELSKYENLFVLDVLPKTITKDGYVYLSYTNIKEEIILINYKNIMLSYNSPTLFLNLNKNLIYNNESSRIYK